MIGLLVILVLTAFSPAALAQGIVQTTTVGWCSPVISNVTGNVAITCNGVDQKSLDQLNELLDRKQIDLAAKLKTGEHWVRQYLALKDRLAHLAATNKLAQQAETALETGDLDYSGGLLDRLIATQKGQPELLAQSYASRAAVFGLQFNYETAWEDHQKALRERPDDAANLNAAGNLAYQWGQYDKAEPGLKKALAIREKTLGSDDPAVAVSLSDLAALLLQQGRYGEAEPLFRQALAIREKTLSPDDPETGASLSDLATLYLFQARYPEAGRLFQRALTI